MRCQGDGEARDGAERMENSGMRCMEDGETGNGVHGDGEPKDGVQGGWRGGDWGTPWTERLRMPGQDGDPGMDGEEGMESQGMKYLGLDRLGMG